MKSSKIIEEYERSLLDNYEVLISRNLINSLVDLHNNGLGICIAAKQTVSVVKEAIGNLFTNANDILVIESRYDSR